MANITKRMSQTLILSDLHLSKRTLKFNDILIIKLLEWKKTCDALYLLGDIFDMWIGDDIIEKHTQNIINALKSFSEHKPLFLMHGNRDFLIGANFLQVSGAVLLKDPSVVQIYHQYYILTHGDLLCTDDIQYQNFRTKTRDPDWQKNILKKPPWCRKLLANSIRTFSSYKGKSTHQLSISDATALGVHQLKNTFITLPDADIIHGHTHRPAIHTEKFKINNACYHFKRYVLPDWRKNVHGAITINEENKIQYVYF